MKPSKQCQAKAWEANTYREHWGRAVKQLAKRKCAYCGDLTSGRSSIKLDGKHYCSVDCSISTSAEVAIIEELWAKRRLMKEIPLGTKPRSINRMSSLRQHQS